MMFPGPPPAGHHSVKSVAAAFKKIDKTKWLPFVLALAVLALAVAAIGATNPATTGVTIFQYPLWDNAGQKGTHAGHHCGNETAIALKGDSLLGPSPITLNIRSLVARNSFKDPVIHDAIVDIKLTPKCHPLQEVLNACSWALTHWGGVMLVVLATVAAAFRMISDKRERPVAIEHAARGRGLSASSAAGRGAMVQPTGWTRARNCGRWLLVLCVSSHARSSAAFDCTEDSQCQYEGCDNIACSSSDSRCVDGIWTASCLIDRCWTPNYRWCPDPRICVAGEYSPSGKNFRGNQACAGAPCAAGKYGPHGSTSFSWDICTDCEAGKYSGVPGASSCLNCDRGQYSAGAGASSVATCVDCVAGKYSTSSASSRCTDCVASKYSAGTGASSVATCVDCVAGKYSASSASSTCTGCVAGKYSGTSASGCIACPGGKYSATVGFSISGVTCQTSLETGFQRAQPFDGKPSYISIDGTLVVYHLKGYEQWFMGDTLGSRARIESSANDVPEYGWQEFCSGAWQDSNLRLHGTGASSVATCVDCVAGKYSASSASSTCTDCVAGKYSAGTGASSVATCVDCVAGKYSASSASSRCTDCVAGKYSGTSASLCAACPGGKYSVTVGAESDASCMIRCGPGFYSTSTGEATFYSETCIPCPYTRSAPAGSSSTSDCTLCAAGFFGPARGPCAPCPTGTYKSAAGSAAACTPCPIDGQWSPTGSVSADDCMEISISEVCPKAPVLNFNEPQFQRCQTPFTWDDLFEGYRDRTITYKHGSLGRKRAVPGTFESWMCVHGDPCATDLVDGYFCYVYHEQEARFVPWGPNAVLKLLPTRETQDEMLHLRAKVVALEAVVANLTSHMSTLMSP